MFFSKAYKSSPGVWITIIALLTTLILLVISATATAKGKPGGGGGTDSAWIEIIASGSVTASQSCEERLASDSNNLLCNGRGYEIMLGDYFIDRVYENGHGSQCFGNGIWNVTIGVWEDKDGSAGAILRWHAPDTNNVEVLYALEVYGLNWSDHFPPASPGTITMQADDWLLRTGNKRQSRNACVGEGSFSATDSVKVELIRLP